MSDPRQTPANDRVASAHLADADPSLKRVDPLPRQVRQPVVDMLNAPGERRIRQLLWGETVDLLETRDGWSFVQAHKDGYVGYVQGDSLGTTCAATHRVSALATHLYSAPDFKAREHCKLSFGSQLAVVGQSDQFAQTGDGFVPLAHLSPVDASCPNLVEVAEQFLGTPYLWGGNSCDGIDCSGLVQAAFIACGLPCPADSDQQEAALGHLANDTEMQRGDLLFWKGHVALVADKDRLIHANVHHMAVRYEPLHAAIDRIQAQGDGPVTSHKRPF